MICPNMQFHFWNRIILTGHFLVLVSANIKVCCVTRGLSLTEPFNSPTQRLTQNWRTHSSPDAQTASLLTHMFYVDSWRKKSKHSWNALSATSRNFYTYKRSQQFEKFSWGINPATNLDKNYRSYFTAKKPVILHLCYVYIIFLNHQSR